MGVPERLLELRKNRQLTQKQIYESLNMAPTVYKRYEYGENVPTANVLIKFADYYNVSLDYLVGRSDNPNRL